MVDQWLVRNSLILLCFLILAILFLVKKQDKRTNWAVFYATLWVSITLTITNYYCVNTDYWHFISKDLLVIKMPFDLLFIWIVLWGVIPAYFFKGKFTLLILLFLFWIDLLLMPELEKIGIIQLNENWLIGEIILLVFVLTPSYLWAKFSYNNSKLKFRVLFQVLIMSLIFLIGLPFIVILYTTNNFLLKPINPYLIQTALIIALPSLVAVMDLVKKGKGTPFPYDSTTNLVQSGVYAYCKNPIQWSFTLLFIPLSIYYNNFYLLFGSLVSVAYTIGVSNHQENSDLEIRFGKNWITYKNNVPSWRFLWKPKNIPESKIYFKKNCPQCEQIKTWFENRNTQNLKMKYAAEYKSCSLLQVTYIDNLGMEYKSVEAIANGLEHINLCWASLGWFIKTPGIKHILQAIIDSMDFNIKNDNCDC